MKLLWLQVEALLSVINTLVKDQTDQPPGEPDPEDFTEEQCLVGRLIHLFNADSPDGQYTLLSTAKKHFGLGGTKRIKFTVPSMAFKCYQLAFWYKQSQVRMELKTWFYPLNLIQVIWEVMIPLFKLLIRVKANIHFC